MTKVRSSGPSVRTRRPPRGRRRQSYASAATSAPRPGRLYEGLGYGPAPQWDIDVGAHYRTSGSVRAIAYGLDLV
jgi:hypothetical protein